MTDTRAPYEPPQVDELGTLAELTQGGPVFGTDSLAATADPSQ